MAAPPDLSTFSWPTSFFAPSQQGVIERMEATESKLKEMRELLAAAPATEEGCQEMVRMLDWMDDALEGLEEDIGTAMLDQAPQGGSAPRVKDEAAGFGILAALPREMMDGCMAHLEHADLARLCAVSRALNQRYYPLLTRTLVFNSITHVHVPAITAACRRLRLVGGYRPTSISATAGFSLDAIDALVHGQSSLESLRWESVMNDGWLVRFSMPSLKRITLNLKMSKPWQRDRRQIQDGWESTLHEETTALRTVHLKLNYSEAFTPAQDAEAVEAAYDLSSIFEQRDLETLTVTKAGSAARTSLNLLPGDDGEAHSQCSRLRALGLSGGSSVDDLVIEAPQLLRVLRTMPFLTRLYLDVQLASSPEAVWPSVPKLPHLRKVEVNLDLIWMLPGFGPSSQLELIGFFRFSGSLCGDAFRSALENGLAVWESWVKPFQGAFWVNAGTANLSARLCYIAPNAKHLRAGFDPIEWDGNVESRDSLKAGLSPLSSSLETLVLPLLLDCTAPDPGAPPLTRCDKDHAATLNDLFELLPSLKLLVCTGHPGFFERLPDPSGPVLCRWVDRDDADPKKEDRYFHPWEEIQLFSPRESQRRF